MVWWRDDRKPRILLTERWEIAFLIFSSTTKDAKEEFFTAFIRVYIKPIASLYQRFIVKR